MPTRGKLIVFEGIDGAGKRTQLGLLCRVLAQRSVPFLELSFPRYEGFFGKLIARYLSGEFGALGAVDPHFSALLYAGDRLESRSLIESALHEGKIVVADRYIPSNLAHQGARVPSADRDAFLSWLRQLEYQVYGLPAEDMVIYLRLPASEGQQRVSWKRSRNYTTLRRDIQEADINHLVTAAEMYDSLARQPNWIALDSGTKPDGSRRNAQEIHQAVLAALDSKIFGNQSRLAKQD